MSDQQSSYPYPYMYSYPETESSPRGNSENPSRERYVPAYSGDERSISSGVLYQPSPSHCAPSQPAPFTGSYSYPPHTTYDAYSPTFNYPVFPSTSQINSPGESSRQYADHPGSPYASSSTYSSPTIQTLLDEQDQRRNYPPIPIRAHSQETSRSLRMDGPRQFASGLPQSVPQVGRRTSPSQLSPTERQQPYARPSSEILPTWKLASKTSRSYSEGSYETQGYIGSGEAGEQSYRERTNSPRSQGSDGELAEEVNNDDRQDVTTPFISKLAHLLSHPEYSPVIRWSADGTAFIFAHGSPELAKIFSRFFRHSNTHSFVRQLNIYGFTRLTTLDLLMAIDSSPHPHGPPSAGDYSAFMHPLFYREIAVNPGNLGHLKPKATKKKTSKGDIRATGSSSQSQQSPPLPSPRLELPRQQVHDQGHNSRSQFYSQDQYSYH